MARTNKYTSLNFNDIYEKKLKPTTTRPSSSPSPSPSPSSSSSSSSSFSSATTRTHGRMLVLTRPTPKPKPKPIPTPQPSPPPPPPPPPQSTTQSSEPDQTRLEADPISLRPLGRTGSGPSLASTSLPVLNQERDKELFQALASPKSEKFVPPHLRPGFVGKEERLGPEVQKQSGFRSREFVNRQGQYGSPRRHGEEEGRPKSGGGYERMRKDGGGSDLVEMTRPTSGGNRPSSSGCYCATAAFKWFEQQSNHIGRQMLCCVASVADGFGAQADRSTIFLWD